ncbi:MAG: hypothetical protein QOJ65_75 [Fimbriimonadaceae bacterium]|nr:hypothetical protein [Fimbriimonadaceae bacterium]
MNFSLRAFLCAAVVLSGVLVAAQPNQVLLKPAKQVSAEKLSRLIAPYGRLSGKLKGADGFVVTLNPNRRAADLQTLGKVTPYDPEKRALTSASELDARVRELLQAKDEEGLDAFGARKYHISQRAFPNDEIDYSAYVRAAEHREKMPKTHLGSESAVGTLANPTWQFLGPVNYGTFWGPAPVSGRVTSMAYKPGNTSTFYVGVASGGLWKTTDGGVHYTPLSDSWPSIYVASIAIPESAPDTIYVGTGDFDGWQGYGLGVMKSTNGGATWTRLGVTEGFSDFAISKILIDPDNSNIVTIAEGRGPAYWGYVWRSTDAGATWTKVITQFAPWSDLAISVPSGGIRYMYAASTSGKCYRSADRGVTWMPLTTPLSTARSTGLVRVVTSPVNPTFVYLLDPNGKKVLKSGNNGDAWIDITTNLPPLTGTKDSWDQYWWDAGLTVSRNGSADVLYVGLMDWFQSKDGGASWRSIANVYTTAVKMHPDQHTMVFDPTNPNLALVGCDGGVFKFTWNPTADTWTFAPLTGDLGITQFYSIALHPSNPNINLGGTQDNSTAFCNGDLSVWKTVSGGDGGPCAINPLNDTNQYATSQFMRVVRTNNTWFDWQVLRGEDSSADFIAPMVMDPNDPNLIYCGNTGLLRYTASTGAWENPVGGVALTTSTISAISIAPGNSSRIYVGTANGLLWMSTNKGATWAQIQTGSTSLPNRVITSISVTPGNPDEVLVALSGTGSPHVWRCASTVAASRQWLSVSGSGATGLVDVPVNAIARDPYSPATSWHVASDSGIFSTADSGATWTNSTAPLGLPNVQCDDIKSRVSDHTLYVGTFGRGIWRIQLPPPGLMKSITYSYNPVPGGTPTIATLSLYAAAPPGGTVATLSSDSPAAVVPASVTVPAGATSATFTVNTVNSTYDPFVANIAAAIGSESKVAPLTVNPANYASLVGQTVPAAMIAGQTYAVSVQYRNGGGRTWDTAHGYKLQSRSPVNNTTWGMNRLPLTNGPVAAGSTATFSANVIAPPSTGTFNFIWLPIQDSIGVNFGPATPNVAVAVTKVADAARYIARTGAVTVNAGQDFYVSNTMMNVGTSSWSSAAGYSMMSISPNNNTVWGRNRNYLPGTGAVAPNAQVQVYGLCTAPITPGTYTMQWQMNKNGAPFGDATPLVSITVVKGPDNARFVGQTKTPISMGPGYVFSTTFTMQNLGTATWDSTYSLMPTGSNNFGVAGIASGSVLPNANGTFTAGFTAPTTPGTYTFQWRMQHGAAKFGQPSTSLSIVVSADAAQYVSRTGALAVNAGEDFAVKYKMLNTGTSAWSSASGFYLRRVTPTDDLTWGVNRGDLPTSGTYGQGVSFTFTMGCTAPITPGTYAMQWQMSHGATLFGEKSPLISITVTQGADNAQFVTQTGIPSTVVHGATFTATVTMKNLGTATWDATYSLAPLYDVWGVASSPSGAVGPNATQAFTATFTAPSTPGTYHFRWRMQHGATKFGQSSPDVVITVT